MSLSDRYDEAMACVFSTNDARVSRIHRDLRMPYNEAAKYMERMERGGVVSKPNAVGTRAILLRPATDMEICDQCYGAGGDGCGSICGKCDGAGGYASVDTLPKGRDAKQGSAGTEGSAVVATGDETPND